MIKVVINDLMESLEMKYIEYLLRCLFTSGRILVGRKLKSLEKACVPLIQLLTSRSSGRYSPPIDEEIRRL